MGRLIDCQMAFVTWGVRARFRHGKVGLLRKDKDQVYLAIFFTKTEYYKLPVDPESLAILPAAIRFKDLQKDLFIRNVSNSETYENMLRSIKVLLKTDELRRSGRGDKLDKFIADIPKLNSIRLEERTPSRFTARLVGNASGSRGACNSTNNNNNNNNSIINNDHSDEQMIVGYGNDLLQPRQPCAERNFGYSSNSNNDNTTPMLVDTHEMDKRLKNPNLRSIKQVGVPFLSENLWVSMSLSSLQLIDCNLTSVPKQLEHLSKSLLHLDLSRNSINKLPRTFCCKMNKLTELNLSHNLMETLPLEIKFFSRLVELNLSDNHLRLFPTTFSDLSKLKVLNVANNNLSQLPAFRRDDIKLEILDISSNPLDGAQQNRFNTSQVYPSYDGQLGYEETAYSPASSDPLQQSLSSSAKSRVPRLFEIAMLRVVRCDDLFKKASEESLPRSIVSTMQRDIFKCYRCSQMNMLPAYNSTDYLDYVDHVTNLITTRNYSRGMTFMKLLCRSCFEYMSS